MGNLDYGTEVQGGHRIFGEGRVKTRRWKHWATNLSLDSSAKIKERSLICIKVVMSIYRGLGDAGQGPMYIVGEFYVLLTRCVCDWRTNDSGKRCLYFIFELMRLRSFVSCLTSPQG